MPFIKRRIEPCNIRSHQNALGEVFEEYADVANNALVNALLQLSSLTFHARDIFQEIEIQAKSFYRRCSTVESRIQLLQKTCEDLDAKTVQIPASDLDTEFKIPPHLHYRSCDSIEEDLFITDSRTPCLIHLHNQAGGNFSDVFRGSQAYAKPARPKSFDPNILLQDDNNFDRVLPSKSIANIVSTVKTEFDTPSSELPTPEKKMQLESSQHKAEIITVDTSGSQFDRRVNLRRSQRSTVAAARRKTHKERHKTLTALPDHVSTELGLYAMQRQSSLHSDLNSNSSFVGDGSIASGDSSASPLDHHREQHPDILPSSPVRRRLKNRHSMPVVKSVPGSPHRGARVSLHQPRENVLSTFPRNQNIEKNNSVMTQENGRLPSQQQEVNVNQDAIMRDKNMLGEDRISSGFWSGTESCRHSTTSEILAQHQHVTQALQQVLSNKPAASEEQRFKMFDNDTNASSVSLNSRLSVLEPSTMSSSVVSLSHTHLTDRTSTPDDSMRIPRTDVATPRQLNFSTPAGAYNFMNPNFEEQPPKLPHLASPMDLLILGTRRGNDGMIRDDMESFDASYCSDNVNMSKQEENHVQEAPPHLEHLPVFTPNTPQVQRTLTPVSGPPENQSQFFGPHFSSSGPKSNSSSISKQPSVELSFQDELKSRVKKGFRESVKRPSPPRRQSSLRSRHKEVKEILAYMEPLSKLDSSGTQTPLANETRIPSSKPDIISTLPTSTSSEFSNQNNSSETVSPEKSISPISSYQPSKSVASHLQTRRPVTMYDHYLSSNDSPKRPVSVVEPFTKPLPQTSQSPPFLSDIKKCDRANSTSLLPPPNGIISPPPEVVVYQALHTHTALPEPSTPKSSTVSKVPELPAHYPTASISNHTIAPALSELPKKPETRSKEQIPFADDLDSSPGIYSISPSQLQAASSSLRRIHQSEKMPERKSPASATNRLNESASLISQPSFSISNQKAASKPFSPKLPIESASYNSSNAKEQQISTVKDVNSVVESSKQKDQRLSSNSLSPTDISSNLSPSEKPPVAAKPTSTQSMKKPLIRPKPLLSPRPNSQLGDKTKDNNEANKQQQSTKNNELKTKTANMRAAFFGVQSPTKENLIENVQKPEDEMKKKDEITKASVSESYKPESKTDNSKFVITNGFAEVSGLPREESGTKTDNKSSISHEAEVKSSEISTNGLPITTDPNGGKSFRGKIRNKCEKPADERVICNGTDYVQDPVELDDDGDNITAENLNISAPEKDFKASIQKMRGSFYSTSTNSDLFFGNKSPGNPLNLDRKANFRFSTSSLERKRKNASNSALREDFKALLLQNLSKSSTSQMSATEKLKLARQTPTKSSLVANGEDVAERPAASFQSDAVPLNDIKPAVSRPGRRPNRMPEYRKSYATSPGYLTKKHPPIASSGRYATRSRTPTRPMMAITEDSESELSPEKPPEELQRSKSVGDF